MPIFSFSSFRNTIAIIVLACGLAPQLASAQTISPGQPNREIGLHGFGTFGVDWLSATESLEAVGLEPRPTEFGAGGQVNNIWRSLFAQVSASRWSGTGERAFVSSDGTLFPLGIPLEAKTTYIDVTAGWRFDRGRGQSGQGLVPYVGGGVGVAMYSEKSPFAQTGDDVDERATSYHVLGGVEVWVLRWLGVAGDVRYRTVSGLLGEGGVSEVLGDENLGGTSAAVRVLVGF